MVTPPAVLERLDAWLAAGRREAALEAFYREVVLMSEAEVTLLRAAPTWPARVVAAHTITHEDRAISDATLAPEEAAKMTTPNLMLVGEDSPASIKADYETVAAALPDVCVTILEGQQHILSPEVFAKHVVAFLRDQP